MVKVVRNFFGHILILSILTACQTTTQELDDIHMLQTRVAGDINLHRTLTAISQPLSKVPSPSLQFTSTPSTPQVAGLTPSANPFPQSPTETPTAIPCNKGAFIEDVTVPDNMVLLPDVDFVKTWRIKNTGTCTWTPNYELVYVDGSLMGSSREVSLPDFVLPGETVDISVELTAPFDEGTYRGNWALRNEEGTQFGFGSSGKSPLWVLIKVVEPDVDFYYDFSSNICLALWESGSGELDCSGSEGSDLGFVQLLDNPRLENRYEDEPAIWVVPNRSPDGWIRGEFPEIRVRNGYHFRTWVGCLDDSQGCNVTFSLNYRVRDGSIKNLHTWREAYDGQITMVDLDLSGLAGQSVSFILRVEVERNPGSANAFWFVPRIERVEDNT